MNSKLDELLKEANLPKAGDLLGRTFQYSLGGSCCVGTIISIDNFNDDGWLSFGITTKKHRGDDIQSIDFDGQKFLLILRIRDKIEAFKGGNFELLD